MSPRWARAWFAVTALCVAAGVALSVYSAAAFWVALLLLGLAAGATALDARLGPRRPDAAAAPQTAGTISGPPS